MSGISSASPKTKAGARFEARRLTGGMVLAIFVAFFAVVGGVNAVMIAYAVSSFRGEVVEHPYETGLAFNTEIAAARAQEARDWKVEAKFLPASAARRLQLATQDARGQPIAGLSWSGKFAAPVDSKRDRPFELSETAAGRYEGEIAVAPGRWDLELTAARNGAVLFRSKSRVTVE